MTQRFSRGGDSMGLARVSGGHGWGPRAHHAPMVGSVGPQPGTGMKCLVIAMVVGAA